MKLLFSLSINLLVIFFLLFNHLPKYHPRAEGGVLKMLVLSKQQTFNSQCHKTEKSSKSSYLRAGIRAGLVFFLVNYLNGLSIIKIALQTGL